MIRCSTCGKPGHLTPTCPKNADAHTTLPERILAYYRANPGEWLTSDDIAAKFSVKLGAARKAAHRLVQSGAIQLQRVYVFTGERDGR
jgi:DNA-binding GntR family transcriptional regulator